MLSKDKWKKLIFLNMRIYNNETISYDVFKPLSDNKIIIISYRSLRSSQQCQLIVH